MKQGKPSWRDTGCRCLIFVMVFLIAFVFVIISLTGVSYSFHSGTEECWGCHTRHKSSDPSSTCLTCHKAPGERRAACLSCHQSDLDAVLARTPMVLSDNGSAMTPGGDFYWLKKNFSWTSKDGTTRESSGDKHGHNIISEFFDLSPDSNFSEAPLGSYPSGSLSCCSCHDPHEVKGKTFRLLGSASYNGNLTGFSFSHEAPIASAPPTNRYKESEADHVAYGSGMSEWCSNCHTNSQSSGHSHPSGADARMNELSKKYNSYSSTGKLTSLRENAYLFLVPFETGSKEASSLDPLSMSGPDSNSNVMCLSCHRAHASAFRAIGRWDFDADRLHESRPAKGDPGVADSDVLNSYYGIDVMVKFGDKQRSLCNKCHISD